jgi:23S rRNA (adenine1618-N6)-methyltransferase
MHPRNRFHFGYEFKRLVEGSPALGRFVRPNPYREPSIDYANPAAVKALNQALLKTAYSLDWDIPEGYLCPPVPGRSDYIHILADLLAGTKAGPIPRGDSIRVLDVGVGANGVYPLIGASEYGWRFVGTDTDSAALEWVRKMVARNPPIASLIECRLQPVARNTFRGVIAPGECFEATMCNPPFHASAADARAGNLRKRRNLGTDRSGVPPRNFAGRPAELWCPGGELGFVLGMIEQSVEFSGQFRWFTTLVSKSAHLPRLQSALRGAGALEVRTIEMTQGQKRSRVLAWRFEGDAPARASMKRGR